MRAEKKLGFLGEAIARKFLENKNFELVEKNFSRPMGELDLIMKKNNEIYFIEVKTGYKNGWIEPEIHLTPQKIKKFEKMGEFYLDYRKIRQITNHYGIKEEIRYHFWAIIVLVKKNSRQAEVKIIKDLSI